MESRLSTPTTSIAPPSRCRAWPGTAASESPAVHTRSGRSGVKTGLAWRGGGGGGRRVGGGTVRCTSVSIRSSLLTADRDLQLVARRRQVERPADVHERLRHADRDPPLHALWLDLRLLAQALGVEHARDREPDRERHDPTPGCGESHQKRK